MAVTAAGRSLTETHRLAQAALSKSTVAEFLAAWRLLDPADVAATFPGYFRAAMLIIAANRQKSTALAAAYLRQFRRAEGVTSPLTVARAAALAEEQAMKSLAVTGPVAIQRGMRTGLPEAAAARAALSLAAGAASRLVLNAGRETILQTAAADPEVQGVARVTDGSPCAFCAMLASRGAVYTSRATAEFKAHDRCGCVPELSYSSSKYRAPGERFAGMWEAAMQAAKDETGRYPYGDAALPAFRRYYAANA